MEDLAPAEPGSHLVGEFSALTDAEERSDKMFLTMIQRHLQQCVDLNSAEFLVLI
jgi:hypothetical protein